MFGCLSVKQKTLLAKLQMEEDAKLRKEAADDLDKKCLDFFFTLERAYGPRACEEKKIMEQAKDIFLKNKGKPSNSVKMFSVRDRGYFF